MKKVLTFLIFCTIIGSLISCELIGSDDGPPPTPQCFKAVPVDNCNQLDLEIDRMAGDPLNVDTVASLNTCFRNECGDPINGILALQ